MQTLGEPPLKTNGFTAGYAPNCEGWSPTAKYGSIRNRSPTVEALIGAATV